MLDEANWRDIANKIEIQIVIERGVVCIRSCDRAISRLPATPSAVWAGDGPSVVKVIDLFSQATTHVISTGSAKRADELRFDPRDQPVLVANDAESPFPFVSIISTVNYSILARIAMNGTVSTGGTIKSPAATNGIEQCQWDRRTGKFYVNIPEVNGPGNDTQPGAVVEISPKKLQMTVSSVSRSM